jgi:hypothetical protein
MIQNLFIARDPDSKYPSWQAKIPTKSGNFYLSIVAGPHQYSTPKEFVDTSKYTEVELAIFRMDGEWATKEEASPVFPIIGEGQYAFWEEGSRYAVFSYVDIELIDKVVEAL